MSKYKIMIVDDEKLMLKALERALRREGYELILKSNGIEALEYLKSDPDVCVIVSDYRMPKMTGVELLVEVRRHFPGIVRILLTGHADLNAAIEGINNGKLYRFITKPWDDSELKEHLRKAISFRKTLIETRKAVKAAGKAYLVKGQKNAGIL